MSDVTGMGCVSSGETVSMSLLAWASQHQHAWQLAFFRWTVCICSRLSPRCHQPQCLRGRPRHRHSSSQDSRPHPYPLAPRLPQVPSNILFPFLYATWQSPFIA